MAALILDASVLIGLLDRADVHHQRAVDDVEAADAADRDLITPASAYSEALVAGELLTYDERLRHTAQEA